MTTKILGGYLFVLTRTNGGKALLELCSILARNVPKALDGGMCDARCGIGESRGNTEIRSPRFYRFLRLEISGG